MQVYKEASRHKRCVSVTLSLSLSPPPSFTLARRAAYVKAKNTFLLFKIIFNPSLVLSLHVALLSLIFADNAFLALSLISAERISKLVIPLSYK